MVRIVKNIYLIITTLVVIFGLSIFSGFCAVANNYSAEISYNCRPLLFLTKTIWVLWGASTLALFIDLIKPFINKRVINIACIIMTLVLIGLLVLLKTQK